MKLLQYRQRIDTECTNLTQPVLSIKAIKLDGEGKGSLKNTLGLASIKTCDYLRSRKGEALLIECSDLVRQHNNEFPVFQQLESLAESVADPEQKKRLCRKIERMKPDACIRQEMRYKCIHSLLLLYRLGERSGFRVEEKFNRGIKFVVAICTHSTSDVMAFQHLRQNLQATLKGVADSVCVVPANQLDKLLSA